MKQTKIKTLQTSKDSKEQQRQRGAVPAPQAVCPLVFSQWQRTLLVYKPFAADIWITAPLPQRGDGGVICQAY